MRHSYDDQIGDRHHPRMAKEYAHRGGSHLGDGGEANGAIHRNEGNAAEQEEEEKNKKSEEEKIKKLEEEEERKKKRINRKIFKRRRR